MNMKAPVVAIIAFLTIIYLSALLAVAKRAQVQGCGAAAQESERTHTAPSSKVVAAKGGPQTPGELLTQNKNLSDKLGALLRQQNPPVTDLQAASQGFTNLGELFAAVHTSQNLGIPFDQLKAQEQTSGSLADAIHTLKPNADTKAEVGKAALQALDDLDKTPGALLAQNKRLSDKLGALLRQQDPPLTDLLAASQGFTNLGQVFAAVHISQNLDIPLDQLKAQEQTSGSLADAIHTLKPNADTKAELWKAAEQAVDDLEDSYWATARSFSPSM
jgi:hypothetical protein